MLAGVAWYLSSSADMDDTMAGNDTDDMMPVEQDNGIGDGAGAPDGEQEAMDADTQVQVAQSLDFVGLTEAQAEALSAENNITFRVVERDGESLPVTMDYRPGRINASVDNGVITSVTVEGAAN